MMTLDLTTKGFSLQNARTLLAASGRAYSQAPTIEAADTQVLIEMGQDDTGAPVLVISFRGTTDIADWITDARFWRIKVGTLEMHHGFWNGWKCVAEKVIETCVRNLPAPIVVTGHSLGGALAILCAKDLAGCGFPVRAVYTFGQPRVGNSAFASAYDETICDGHGSHGPDDRDQTSHTLGDLTWRVVNQEDIVTRLPGYLIGYRNIGRQVFFPALPATGWPMPAMRINPPLWFKAISDLIGAYQEWKRGRLCLLQDHFADSYLARLGRAA